MHRRPRSTKLRLTVPLLTTLFAMIGAMVFAVSSSATNTIKATFTDAYIGGVCTLGIDNVPNSGTVNGYLIAQDQPSSLAGYLTVTSSHVYCAAYDASGLIQKFDVGGGAIITPKQQNYIWNASSSFRVCGYATVTLLGGATDTSPVSCSS